MRLHGIIPPTVTPFKANGDLDLHLVKGQVDWLIAQGVHGLACAGSTGEGHAIDAEEHRDLLAATVEAVAGRVPILAGIIADSTREAIKRGRMVKSPDVGALQVTPVHYLFRPHDDAMVAHFRAVAEETGQPVIIYNVVPWCYLSPALLLRIFREVPGVLGVKQSAGDLKLLADLLVSADAKNLIFSAVDALLYPSYVLGAHGAIAATLTAAPKACVDVWDAVKAGDHARALDLHERLLGLWNALQADNLPACVRHAQQLQGVASGVSRAPMPEPSDDQKNRIKEALSHLVPSR
jgi:4-hydroxy-tetrahydrodipicolinate synthase